MRACDHLALLAPCVRGYIDAWRGITWARVCSQALTAEAMLLEPDMTCAGAAMTLIVKDDSSTLRNDAGADGGRSPIPDATAKVRVQPARIGMRRSPCVWHPAPLCSSAVATAIGPCTRALSSIMPFSTVPMGS